MPRLILAFLATTLLGIPPLLAQQKRVSPHETISQTFDGKRDNRVTIVYGRPYSKDPKTGATRKIWGTLVPYGKVWRLGSDEATLLITQQPVLLGGTEIPAGAHTLFMQPEADGTAKLIVSTQLGQWGLQYNAANDFARVDLTMKTVDKSVDEFTMGLAKNPAGGGVLTMTWENTEFSVPFTIVKK